MKPFTSDKNFKDMFYRISNGQKWSLEKINIDGNFSIKVYNDKDCFILPKELDLKLLNYVDDGVYTIVSIFNEKMSRAKADGLIRFCWGICPMTLQGKIHYELTYHGTEYVHTKNDRCINYIPEVNKIYEYGLNGFEIIEDLNKKDKVNIF